MTVSDHPYLGGYEQTLTHENFLWDHTIPWDWWEGYGCSIYEVAIVNGKWVRGDSVAQVHFYNYQEAALYLSVRSFFELSQYYCTIDWEPVDLSWKYGHTEGCWEWVGEEAPCLAEVQRMALFL